MTKIFYDTEFHEDGTTIDLISIGMVRDDGETYYAVSIQADYVRAAGNPWLRQNVLCYLPMLTETRIDPDNITVKPRGQIRAEVSRFVLGVDQPELWAWYGAYDHVVLAQLFGRMIDLPAGFPMWTNDLRQEVHRLGNPPLPTQAGKEHHALADARQVRLWAEYLDAMTFTLPYG